MEKLIHTGSTLPLDLVVTRITLPDDDSLYETPLLSTLPDDWNILPGSPAAAAYGDAFLFKGKYLGLIVTFGSDSRSQEYRYQPESPNDERSHN